MKDLVKAIRQQVRSELNMTNQVNSLSNVVCVGGLLLVGMLGLCFYSLYLQDKELTELSEELTKRSMELFDTERDLRGLDLQLKCAKTDLDSVRAKLDQLLYDEKDE